MSVPGRLFQIEASPQRTAAWIAAQAQSTSRPDLANIANTIEEWHRRDRAAFARIVDTLLTETGKSGKPDLAHWLTPDQLMLFDKQDLADWWGTQERLTQEYERRIDEVLR
jgi:hypothetical protein